MDTIARWSEIGIAVGGAILAVMAAYYKMDARVLLTEQRVDQESKGYMVLQGDMRQRLERLEDKIDELSRNLIERRR